VGDNFTEEKKDYLSEYTENRIIEKLQEIRNRGIRDDVYNAIDRLMNIECWKAKLVQTIFQRERIRTEEIIKLTKRVENFTKALVALTLVLAFVSTFEIIQHFQKIEKYSYQKKEYDKKNALVSSEPDTTQNGIKIIEGKKETKNPNSDKNKP
jgi:hypothetical protein